MATTQYPSFTMKQAKILLLAAIVVLPLALASCAPWGGQAAGGWAGTSVYEGTIYVGTLDGRVVAVNSSTGNLEWAYSITPTTAPSGGLSCGESSVPTAIYSTPVVYGDLVYIGTYSGQVYALTIARGADRWVYPRTSSIGAIVGTPVVVDETIYVSSSDSTVYALDAAYGDLEGEYEILDEKGQRHEKLWTSPVVHEGTVYVSTLDGYIYGLSTETGELEWSFKSEAGFASAPMIYEDTMFLGSFDRYLYAIKIGSNMSVWRFPEEEPAGNWFWVSPVINDGIVYAGCLDGLIYAIEAETGEKMWEFDTGKAIVSSPVLMDNLLIVINGSGTVYVFDLSAELGNETAPSKTVSIDAAVGSSFCGQEGLIYIRGDDNHLYAVDIDVGRIIWEIDLGAEE